MCVHVLLVVNFIFSTCGHTRTIRILYNAQGPYLFKQALTKLRGLATTKIMIQLLHIVRNFQGSGFEQCTHYVYSITQVARWIYNFCKIWNETCSHSLKMKILPLCSYFQIFIPSWTMLVETICDVFAPGFKEPKEVIYTWVPLLVIQSSSSIWEGYEPCACLTISEQAIAGLH